METFKNERGSVLLYVAGSLIVMALFVGLAIDGGWTTYVRDQGQDAVEAAALSAASAIPTYQVSATSSTIELRAAAFAQKAASSASANRIMQQVPMLTLANNIDCLHYDQTSNTFTCEDQKCTGSCTPAQVNAVRVSMADSAKGNNAINTPLFFGKLAGMPSMRINVSAVGYVGCPGTCSPSTCGPELPLSMCDQYVGYPDKCGQADALQVPDGADNSGYTTFYIPNTNTNDCRNYVNNPSTIPSAGAGDTINVTNGQLDSCLKAIQTQFNQNQVNGKWCVFMAVVHCAGGNFTGALPVTGFAQMCITRVVNDGNMKYIRGFLNCDVSVNSGPSGGACFGLAATNPILIR